MSWFTTLDLAALSPLMVLALGAFAALLADAFLRAGRSGAALPLVALGTVATAALAALSTWGEPRIVGGGALALGPFALYFALLILAAAAIACLYSIDYARRLGFEIGEYYGLLLLATCGMLYLVAANDLVSLFIAFELMSLSVYSLVGAWRGDPRGGEGAMKYFVLGSFSSAFLLYGLALLYGATGTIYLDRMAPAAAGSGVAGAPTELALAAISMIVVGFAFKVGAVPFHAWIPDAYQGAPASVTGFMAVAVKAAAFAVFIRILSTLGLLSISPGGPFPGGATASTVLATLAIATMVLGNFAAVAQKSMQRLLAYSGIAHSGYVLVGLAAAAHPTVASGAAQASSDAVAAALYYLVGYGAMTIGAFAVLTLIRRDGKPVDDVEDLAGLAAERPGAALAMTLFMVSLIGIPPTAGFMGKLWVFRAAVNAGHAPLVIVAVCTTAVSVYYYLRVVVVMYMSEPSAATATAEPRAEASFGGVFATVAAAAAVILIGVFPAGTLEHATRSVAALVGK